MSKWICLGFVACASVAGNGFAASDGSDAAEVCGSLFGVSYTLAHAKEVFPKVTSCKEARAAIAEQESAIESGTFMQQ